MGTIALKKNEGRMNAQKADFRPFKTWRYSPEIDLSKVIAPPYDVISPAEREVLYAQSPFNVVRLIFGKETDFYEEAGRRWKDWRARKVLAQDKRPAFYLYEQSFRHPLTQKLLQRTAVVGVLKLEEPGAVFRHETTFEGPKRDRLSLLEKVEANLSPVFGLYPDPKKISIGLVQIYRNRPPLFEAQDNQGVSHKGWAIEDEKDQSLVHEALRNEKILIADGHHRYETALEYRRRMREKNPKAGEAPYDFVMMALVASGDEGLIMLPTHRVIRTLKPSSKEVFVKRLKEYFDFKPVPAGRLFETVNSQPANEKVFGVVFSPEEIFLLRLKNLEAIRPSLPPGKPAIWYEIEVNLLSHFIFDILWQVPAEKRLGVIDCTHFDKEAIETVQGGRAEAAFILRASAIDTVRELAYAGERLPQKTTYFYPKLASGLFFYDHG